MRNLLFSLLHDLGIPAALRKARINNREIAVLMFHRVNDENDPLWPAIPIRTFKLLMQELFRKACVLQLENIGKINKYPDKPLVALSFDDGYLDFLENALPILSEFGLPAHHNVCPQLIDNGIPPWTYTLNRFLQHNSNEIIKLPNGRFYKLVGKVSEKDYIKICDELCNIGDGLRQKWISSIIKQIPESKNARLMTWDQIKECARQGIHIGSHGMNHLNISKIQDENILLTEIKDSKKRIFEETGIDPLIFAFPRGLYSARSLNTVKNSGYKVALLCDDMVTTFTSQASSRDFYVFPRINISRPNWKEENMRFLGLHQKLKSAIKRTPYIYQQMY